ncbi:MAG: MFS transporter [Salinisphaeraceae bacterium]|nr:MFS transporter [Salinisphaeraceae bacterium]
MDTATNQRPPASRRSVISWALYDWGNSAFATTIMAGFFPVFFKQYWAAESDATTSTLHLGTANSIASLVIVLLAPVLGAVADAGGVRKRFLGFFLILGVLASGGLYWVGQGEWFVALVLLVLGTIGFAGGNIFYDSLLVNVSTHANSDRISALGFSLGYLGGGLLFAINVAMTLKPEIFGLGDAATAVRVSFLTVAAWWFLFAIPLFVNVQEDARRSDLHWAKTVRGAFRQLASTFRQIRQLRMTFLFLLAYWLYIDGVDTIIRMAVDYGLALGFEANSLIVALLITQFVGFPAALFFGWLGSRIGTKRALYIALAVYIGVTCWGYFLDNVTEFYAMAITIGLVQGGVQALSRSMYSRLIPQHAAAEFFGFYNMLGKFAAVIGPIMVGWVAVLTGNPRAGILSILLLFVAGGVLLAFVNEEEGRRAASQTQLGGDV